MFNGGEIVGFVKFFRDEWKLDKLIEGCFYCNTPEFYRLSKDEGVSDKFESSIFTYRQGRGDSPVILTLGDLKIEDMLGLTVQSPDDYDSWLHCWMAFSVPRNNSELQSFKKNISRMKREFGIHYAYLPYQNLAKLKQILSKITTHKVEADLVQYSPNKSDWNTFCKSIDYAYQCEFRFAIGKCSTNTIEHIEPKYAPGFSKLIFKNVGLKLQGEKSKEFYLDLDSL